MFFSLIFSSCQPVTNDIGGGTGDKGGTGAKQSDGKPFFTLTVRASNKRSAGDSLRTTVTYEPEVTWESEQGFRSAVTDFVITVGNEAPQTVQLGSIVSSRGTYPEGSDVTVSYEAYGNVTFKNERGKTETKREVIASESKTVKFASSGTTVNFKVSDGIKIPDSYTEVVEDGKVKYVAGMATLGNVTGLPDEKEYAPGAIVTVADEPSWSYGGFMSWRANVPLQMIVGDQLSTVYPGGTIISGNKFIMPESGVVLTADWNETNYTIAYTPGTGQGAPSQSGFKAITPPDNKVALSSSDGLSKVGEVMTGWQTADGNVIGRPNEMVPTVDLIQLMGGGTTLSLTAKWEVLPTFAVTFAAGDQASAQNMPQNTQSYYGGIVNLTFTARPTVTGYDFKGWKVTKTDSGEVITTLSENDTQYTMPGEYAITLTAQWQIKTFNVTYNTGSGGPTIPSHTRTYGQSFNLNPTSVSMTRSGFNFISWTWQKPGSNPITVTGGTSTSEMQNYEGDIEFTAQWSINYKTGKADWAVGDVVLQDTSGNIVAIHKDAYDSRDTTKGDGVAVVYKKDSSNRKVHILGKDHEEKVWAVANSKGYEIIDSLVTRETRVDDPMTFDENSYIDGSTGLEKFLGTATDVTGADDSNFATKYPAWDYACNYGKNKGLAGELYSGWYFPSFPEMYAILGDRDSLESAFAIISGGTLRHVYWTSTQMSQADGEDFARVCDGNDGMMEKYIVEYVCPVKQLSY